MADSEKKGERLTAGSQNAVLQMIVTMADTTWRMFVPILGFLFVGIYLDKTRGLFPWFSLAGFVVGIAVSSLLIRNQFLAKRPDTGQKGVKTQ